MSVGDVRPGMVGVGRTVFDGTHVEEFKAHIIGVLDIATSFSRSSKAVRSPTPASSPG